MPHLMPINASDVATIVGIDPGSETLGLCRISFNVNTLQIVSTQAQTYIGTKIQTGMSRWILEYQTERFARIHAHKLNLGRILIQSRPLTVACESPFYSSRRPGAFSALTEVISALRYACFEYDPRLPFTLIDPPSAKIAVGAKGNAKKEQVQEAVLQLPDLNFIGDVSLNKLDEHSIDSIAIAYSKIQEWRQMAFAVTSDNLSAKSRTKK